MFSRSTTTHPNKMVDPVALIHPDADVVSGDEDEDAVSEHGDPTFADSDFSSDLFHAKTELRKVVFYLNAVSSAAQKNNSSGKFDRFVDGVGDKLVTALAFYRQYSRALAIRSRLAQESLQISSSLPSADLCKLERLESELERTKNAVEKLIAPNYSIFEDLKMATSDELFDSKPDLSSKEHASTSEEFHFLMCERLGYEGERRRQLMVEVEELTKKKRALQDDVRKRRELMNAVNSDVEKSSAHIPSLAVKLGVKSADLEKDISLIDGSVLEALSGCLDSEEAPEETASDVVLGDPPASLSLPDDELMEETPDILSPSTAVTEPSDEMETDLEVIREEGEASDEGEEETCAN